jgi:hypothetical protein
MSKYRKFVVVPGISGFKIKMGCSEAYFSTAEGEALIGRAVR